MEMTKEEEIAFYKQAVIVWKISMNHDYKDRLKLHTCHGLCCYFQSVGVEFDDFKTLLIKKLIDKELKRVNKITIIAPLDECMPRINLLEEAIKILEKQDE